MKTTSKLFSLNSLLILLMPFYFTIQSRAQLGDYSAMIDTLLTKEIESGFMWWQQPNPFIPGQCFEQYRIISGDTLNNAALEKIWVDPQLNMTHYRYQQTFKDIPVEGAYAIEHFNSSGKLIFTNAKLAINLSLAISPTLTEAQAKQALLKSLDPQWIMAWDSTSWENALKQDVGNSAATWEPTGFLLLALDNYRDLHFYIDGDRYRLAYQFDVRIISPDEYIRYTVDANTGEVFRQETLRDHDGLATVHNSTGGIQGIDTRYRTWPNADWVLETDNDEKKIHCKKYTGNPFPWRAEIDKDSEPWTGSHTNATSAYWYTRQSWLYFKNIHNRNGMDDDNARVRVHIEHPSNDGTETGYFKFANINNLVFDFYEDYHLGNYHDVVAHEFTHGVIRNSSALAGVDEPGALNESFADIFGLMAERITVNGEVETNLTWTYGFGIHQRLFDNPNGGGDHITDDMCLSKSTGQPDTYKGLYWTDVICNSDKHSKGGVQNFWFYLLSEGGSGTNDIGDTYSVSGIGETKASKITYWSMVNEMMTSSQFSDARAGAESAAILLYGECSNEHIQTVNAWHAVGVGEKSDCPGASITRLSDPTTFHIYPNPMADQFAIVWDTEKVFDVTLYSIDGKILFIQKGVTSGDFIIPPSISKGIYFVEARSGEKIIRKQIIKN